MKIVALLMTLFLVSLAVPNFYVIFTVSNIWNVTGGAGCLFTAGMWFSLFLWAFQ